LGFLSRDRRTEDETPSLTRKDIVDEVSPRIGELSSKMNDLALRLEKVERAIQDMPNRSDFRLLASEIGRLESELERLDDKNKEGMLALYAQVHKELRSIRGDRVIEMIDIEPTTDEKLEEASDQLSELAKTWRKRRVRPPNEG
jgi:DNA repair exonuclease SbcCD ATPase subunit